jgi:hypothetical protein
VIAAAPPVKETDPGLARYRNVTAAFAAGYTYILRANREGHLRCGGGNPYLRGPQSRGPSSLVYAINVPHHAPVPFGRG